MELFLTDFSWLYKFLVHKDFASQFSPRIIVTYGLAYIWSVCYGLGIYCIYEAVKVLIHQKASRCAKSYPIMILFKKSLVAYAFKKCIYIEAGT